MKWILASQSPRRRERFGQIIQEFDIIPAKGEEDTQGETSPERVVVALAAQKAAEVASLPDAKGRAVLGSDTVVALGNTVLGKQVRCGVTQSKGLEPGTRGPLIMTSGNKTPLTSSDTQIQISQNRSQNFTG